MAFLLNELTVLGYANGFTLWHYKTLDAPKDVRKKDYFNAAKTMLRVNDLIVANVGLASDPTTKIYHVSDNNDCRVAVTLFKP